MIYYFFHSDASTSLVDAAPNYVVFTLMLCAQHAISTRFMYLRHVSRRTVKVTHSSRTSHEPDGL
jgi:hypothetical protein